ncbi:MAG TPA: AI-2E family transporter [Pseudonocardiaceae bacterium]|nr:AI-2E family transporter [Pseudonocardiaceae bacterium]
MSAALSWRLVAVLLGVVAIAYIFGYLAVVLIPVAIALLLSALLAPAVARLVRWNLPRGLATAVVVIGGLAAVGGVLSFVISEFSDGLPALTAKVSQSVSQISNWLQHGPLHLTQAQLQSFLKKLTETLGANESSLTSGLFSTATTVGEVLTGILLALFTLIFFLYDGRAIWSFVLLAVPGDIRDRVNVAGRRGYASLVAYIRATVAVAFVDALGIGIGLAIVRVPLAAPLAALVFIGAFIPIVGSVLAGTVAVLVALVANGFVPALIVLAIVIAVMQLESHVLQPFLMGRAVRLHPLAVVLAIGIGAVVSGIVGALLAVPLLAVLNAGIRSLLHDPPMPPSKVNALRRRDARPSSPAPAPGTEPSAAAADSTPSQPAD